MDSKVTLSFKSSVIEDAKAFAASKGLSLSRLTELLLSRAITADKHQSIEDYPVAEWVSLVAEGSVEYGTQRKNRKKLKDEFFASKG